MSKAPPLDFGPYRTPRFRYGATVQCQVRGDVVIVGISTGRIPWPLGRRKGARGNGYVVYKDLAKAIRRESARSMKYWFGLGHGTVTSLRKALGVPAYNEGTRRGILRACKMPQRRNNIRQAIAKAGDPERRAKIAAALRGRKLPKYRLEAMQRGRHRQPETVETRLKWSEIHKRRGSWPPAAGRPWTSEEDALVRSSLLAKDVAARIGRTVRAVQCRRYSLRVNAMSKGSRRMRLAAYSAWYNSQRTKRGRT